ncbi:hypothetical protein [Labedaea rhizosphaerae]|uniref:Secreted protein n=1 Tax=Labedaea rhizosphaerae TaxID=598644 RepID=A0A4R6SNI1_LABRH|nr:hypothetical protein [Labedaea rhizosphaerae]TDQ05481.1 hypothetical protein EV186_1011452 [Labedaea rhizosphaerae]
MSLTRKFAAAGCLAACLAVAAPAIASADPAPTPGPITVTLSADQAQFLCTKRLPKVQERTKKLVARINGDENTRGSTKWLQARAQKEKAAGRTTTAQLLTERASRRAGQVDKLNQINQWATDFSAKYCGGSK